jgi:hypothetical protein
MNLATITSIIRHWLTAAAGVLGLWLIANLALSGDESKQLTESLAKLIEPTVAVLGLVAVAVARLAIKWLGKVFGWGAGEIGDRNSGIPIWLGMIGTAVVIGGSLPSCSLGGMPVTVSALLPEGKLSYSSKGGLNMEYNPGFGQMPEVYRGSNK